MMLSHWAKLLPFLYLQVCTHLHTFNESADVLPDKYVTLKNVWPAVGEKHWLAAKQWTEGRERILPSTCKSEQPLPSWDVHASYFTALQNLLVLYLKLRQGCSGIPHQCQLGSLLSASLVSSVVSWVDNVASLPTRKWFSYLMCLRAKTRRAKTKSYSGEKCKGSYLMFYFLCQLCSQRRWGTCHPMK